MLTGATPYRGDSGLALAMQHVSAPVPDPRERDHDLPAMVAEVVVRAMQKLPQQRYGSAEEMRDALAACRAAARLLTPQPVPHGWTPAPAQWDWQTPPPPQAAVPTWTPAGVAPAPSAVPAGHAPDTPAPAETPGAAAPGPPPDWTPAALTPYRSAAPPAQQSSGAAASPESEAPAHPQWTPDGVSPYRPAPESEAPAHPQWTPDGVSPYRPAPGDDGRPPWVRDQAAPEPPATEAQRDQGGAAARAGTRRRRRPAWPLIVAAALVLGLAGLGGAYWAGRSDNRGGGGGVTGTVTPVTRLGTDGKPEWRVPVGLVNDDYRVVRDKLVAAGLTVQTEFEVSQFVDKDKVVEVFPSEGEYTADRSVTMTISAGKGEQARVPSGLVGATYAVARDKLVKAGFAVEVARTQFGDGPTNVVARVDPAEGSLVLKNSEVTLWLPEKKKG